MYACGDTVVYRHHVCEVAALRENYFEGKDYLCLLYTSDAADE